MQAPKFRAPGNDVHERLFSLKALGRAGRCLTASTRLRLLVATALLAIIGQSASAEVVFQGSGGNQFPGQSSGTVTGVNVTSIVNCIVVGVHIRGTDNDTITQVAPNGVTYTLGLTVKNFVRLDNATATFIDNTGINPRKRPVRTEMWILVNPPIGNGGSISVTLAPGAGNPARFLVGYTMYSGVNPAHPVRNSCVAVGRAGTAVLTFGTEPGDLLIDALTTDDTASPSAAAGQTLRYSLETNFGSNGVKGRAGTLPAAGDACPVSISCPLNTPTAGCTTLSYTLGGLFPFVIGAVALENQLAPTAVEIASFSATRYKSGDVVLEWGTGSEVNSLGFNIYREENGKRTRVTTEPIAGSALQIGAETVLRAGGSYLWTDKVQKRSNDVQYWIEALDLDGKSTWHGPVAALRSNGNQPKGGNAKLMSASLATQGSSGFSSMGPVERTSSIPTSGASRQQAFQSIASVASQNAVKISVKQEGWYRVGQPQLSPRVLALMWTPRRLQLFVDGQEIPMIVNGEKDHKFDPSDSIEFYGIGLDTPYTIRGSTGL